MVVDDEPAIVTLVERRLRKLGYTVVTHTKAETARAQFNENPDRFDLVLTDLTMPILTGEQLAADLRRTRPDIPILLFTGNRDRIDEHRLRASGINGVIAKPVDKVSLAQAVRKALDNPNAKETSI